MSLRQICADPEMPDAATVLRWTKDDRYGFSQQYADARARQYELLSDQMMDELDGLEPGEVPAARLKFDARRWMLSKMLPKVYGDKIETVHSGRIGLAREMTDEELASIAAAGSI